MAHHHGDDLGTLSPLADLGSAIPIAIAVITVMVVTITMMLATMVVPAMVVAIPPAPRLSFGCKNYASEEECCERTNDDLHCGCISIGLSWISCPFIVGLPDAEIGLASSGHRINARIRQNRIASASATMFDIPGMLDRARTSARGFIACQMASAGSLVNAAKFHFSGLGTSSPKRTSYGWVEP